jgi:cobalamin biosynthesis protein CobT
MFSRPIAAVAEKAASSRIIEYASTTAGILAQIGISNYVSNHFGGSDNTPTPSDSESPNADSGNTATHEAVRSEEQSDNEHTDKNDRSLNQRFGRMS